MTRVKVLLEVEVEELEERDLGRMDVNTVGSTLRDVASDVLIDYTRKEFNEPWRVFSVRLVPNP